MAAEHKTKCSMLNNETYVCYCPSLILSADMTIGEAGYEKCDPLHFWGWGVRNFYTFHYVLSGRGRMVSNGREYQISAKDFFFIGPEDNVYYEADEKDPWEYQWVSFNGERAGSIARTLSISSENPIYRYEADDAPSRLIANIYRGALESRVPNVAALGHLYLFLEWLISTFAGREEGNTDAAKQYYYSMINYINSHLHAGLSVEMLASYVGYDRTYVYKLFRRYMNASPMEYIEKLKVFNACRIIDENRYNLQEVSERAGFNNYCWFCKVFKRVAGVTPGGYQIMDDKATVLNCYNLTLPRDVLAELKRYSCSQTLY